MSEPQVARPASPPASFPMFPKLPQEVRKIIWKMAMEPRNIYLFHRPPGHPQRALRVGGTKFVGVPVFFFVNFECSEVAFEKYEAMKVTTNMLANNCRSTHIGDEGWLTAKTFVFVQDGDTMFFDSDAELYITGNVRKEAVVDQRTGQSSDAVFQVRLGGRYARMFDALNHPEVESLGMWFRRRCNMVCVNINWQKHTSTLFWFEIMTEPDGKTPTEQHATSARLRVLSGPRSATIDESDIEPPSILSLILDALWSKLGWKR
ncbi:hypothetical protein F5B17DRAFT_445269 [Nemania serpens]|nr:hypothetical protein F5B17DRAFT_445269 [Nemania serpens]